MLIIALAIVASTSALISVSVSRGDQQISTDGPKADLKEEEARAEVTAPEPDLDSSFRDGLARLAVAGGDIALNTSSTGGPETVPTTTSTLDADPTTTSTPEADPVSTSRPVSAVISLPGPTTDSFSMSEPETNLETFFVSAEIGDDADDGQTPQSPWRSLQAGMDRIQPGQTLYLMDGQYAELRQPGIAHYVMRVEGAPDAWIRIAAAPGNRPEVVANNGNGISLDGDYVEISGLTIRGEGFGVDNAYGWGILVLNSHHVRLIGNRVSNMPVGGISAIGSSNLEFINNIVYDNSFWGTEQGSGISVWRSVDQGTSPSGDGYHDKIVGNVSFRNENKVSSRWAPGQSLITDGNGIIIDESRDTEYTGRTLVANNVVFDNGGRGIIVNRASGVDVVHNTSYHNGRTAGLAGGPVELAAVRSIDVQLFNNLAWSRPGAPAFKMIDVPGLAMGGNVFVTDNPSGQASALDLILSGDPGLVAPNVNFATANFRPTSNSDLIGRGIALDRALDLDADGNPRTVAAPDVGAYEYRPG